MPSSLKPTFSPALLSKANLQNADLQNANLQDVNLQDANLQDANLRDANLRDSNLKDAKLQDANLGCSEIGDKICTNLKDTKNLTIDQIKKSKNWQQACYSIDFRRQLGLLSENPKNCADEIYISK